MKNRTLYWAYGSNLCIRSMARRCPKAKPYEALTIHNSALTFRGVADVVVRKGHLTPGGLWWITKECEDSLDAYEGVRSGFYLKRYLPMTIRGKEHRVLFYQMATRNGIQPPAPSYLDTIAEGYIDFGLDQEWLEIALQEAWENKELTPMLRRRWHARGKQKLARELPSLEASI